MPYYSYNTSSIGSVYRFGITYMSIVTMFISSRTVSRRYITHTSIVIILLSNYNATSNRSLSENSITSTLITIMLIFSKSASRNTSREYLGSTCTSTSRFTNKDIIMKTLKSAITNFLQYST